MYNAALYDVPRHLALHRVLGLFCVVPGFKVASSPQWDPP